MKRKRAHLKVQVHKNVKISHSLMDIRHQNDGEIISRSILGSTDYFNSILEGKKSTTKS